MVGDSEVMFAATSAKSRLFLILDGTPSRSPPPSRQQVFVVVKLGWGGGDRIHELYGNKGVLRRPWAHSAFYR
jgi:hypothetical protein